MLQFVVQKIRNKKWLNLCLLVGIALLVAVFSCHPMFANGSDNQLLLTAFEDAAKENHEFPAVFSRKGNWSGEEPLTVETLYKRMDGYEKNWLKYVDVDPVNSSQYIRISASVAVSNLGVAKRLLSIGHLRNLESHIEVIQGEGFPEGVTTESGAYPCMISRQIAEDTNLVVGEELSFSLMGSIYSETVNDESARFVVIGIFDVKDTGDNYWYHPLDYYEKQIFVPAGVLDELLGKYTMESIPYEENLLLDYTKIVSKNALVYKDYIEQFKAADAYFSCNFDTLLKNYEEESKTAHTILWILELPCVVLLLLFIYMMAGLILGAEEGEIAVFRSRGITRLQTLLLYLFQSLLLSAGGMVLGILMGYFMCKGAASTDAFLQFENKDVRMYTFVMDMLPFGLMACGIAILFMTISVWKRSKITIVELKNSTGQNVGAPFWEKYFLDVILLVVSCYLLYNYNRQSKLLSESVLAGERLDPVVFLDASLFIFSCGLVLLRLTRYLLLFIDRIGKKHWKAADYAVFLQINRTYRRQSFILVFLVMTVAIGIFNASMARTVNANNEDRIVYSVGCDMQVKERWQIQIYQNGYDPKDRSWSYNEPDFHRYENLMEEGLCSSVTRVLTDDNVTLNAGGKNVNGCQLMAIHTREFGETAELKDGLNDSHWFHALNALSQQGNGIIISKNMADALEIKVGDEVSYTRYSPLDAEEVFAAEKAVVVAVLGAFPGYEDFAYEYSEEGVLLERPNYLIVANYAQVVNAFKQTPYDVWMRLSEGTSSEQVSDYLRAEKIRVSKSFSVAEEVEKSRSSALFQITNGMFTMSFVISVLICGVGFLIYWIMSMKNRQQMFGIYRAMGMRMSEIRRMLFVEQIFSSVLPIAVGGGVGGLSTLLFVRLVALVYLPKKHNIPISTYIYGADMARLFVVILAVIVLCFIVLRRQLKNMKIAQALRLGED